MLDKWNAFIRKFQYNGREAWLQKLDTARIRFEETTRTGTSMELRRLSREADITYLIRGDTCESCRDN